MAAVKVLALAGSTRAGSYNKQLSRAAAAAARTAGADVTFVDLAEFPMPLYDGDLEAKSGLPEHAKRLKHLFKSHQGLLVSSPEYNSSISAVLKNAFDWISRPEPNEPSLAAFTGKVAGLMSASPGALGGLRGLVHLRSILGNIQVLVVPEQFALSQAQSAFGADGSLTDPKQAETVSKIARRVVEIAQKLHG